MPMTVYKIKMPILSANRIGGVLKDIHGSIPKFV